MRARQAGQQGPSVIRDALYGNVELAGTYREALDTIPMQRLRRIQQLGLAYLITPGAMHTRFSHSVGVHHLMSEAVRRLSVHPKWKNLPEDEGELLRMAALVHDCQHYPSAHLIEEVGLEWACHETAAQSVFESGPLAEVVVRRFGETGLHRIPALIRHEDPSPLANLLSGAVDTDKLDYLRRDLHHTGYPEIVDQDGILRNYTLVEPPGHDGVVVGIRHAGIPAWETMLFAKYHLYRQVLFSTPVRSATAMLRALVLHALDLELLTREELMSSTDIELLGTLRARLARRRSGTAQHRVVGRLIEGLTDRKLYTASLELPVRRVPRLSPGQLQQAEVALAERCGLAHGEVLLDLPYRPRMLDLDVWVEMEDGEVIHATQLGTDGGLATHHLADAAYHASCRAVVFTSVPVGLDGGSFWATLAACGVFPEDGDSVHTASPLIHEPA